MDEQTLIARLQTHDRHAMDELLAHYGALLRYVAAPIVPDASEREECVSDVCMRVWEQIGRYDPARGSFRTWLTAVARNTALNFVRARRPDTAELTEDLPSAAPSPEESLLREERREALRRALAALSPADRALLYRKYYYLQSTAQIARELGLSERAVEGRLYRLRQRLRTQMGGEWLGS